MPPTAVYIHIPFCTNKCHYCDFTAYLVNGQPIDEYIDALGKEMECWVRQVPPKEIKSIFIGGGTPTILTPPQMKRLLSLINIYFPNRVDDLEYTVEANPGTTHQELLEVMRAGGINRISFGAQTFNDQLLKKIGRIHSADDIVRSVKLAKEIGFNNISIDLIFGLPNQTVDDIKESLERAVHLKPEHFSCYSLKVEEGTLFHQLYERNNLPLPSEDDELAMFQLIRYFLNAKGYYQYEISNFSLQGKWSRHNGTYWQNEEYYGLGVGAHGYVNHYRYANLKGIQEYIHCLKNHQFPIIEGYQVSMFEQMENYMILGLRLTRGINRAHFSDLFHKKIEEVFGEALSKLFQQGLLQEKQDQISLTEKGLLFGNDVFASFIGGG